MSSGFPIDLVLFGMIAAFLVLRLRSILWSSHWLRAAGTLVPTTSLLGRLLDR